MVRRIRNFRILEIGILQGNSLEDSKEDQT